MIEGAFATVLFYLVGAASLALAIGVVMAKSPLNGALALIGALCGQAVLYVMLQASFIAAMQILVYAGAIMVLFTFVIMLLNLGPDLAARPLELSVLKGLGGLGALYLCGHVLLSLFDGSASGAAVDGSVKNIGRLLLSEYLFAFEAISVLLLVAVVGAVVFGIKRLA